MRFIMQIVAPRRMHDFIIRFHLARQWARDGRVSIVVRNDMGMHVARN